MTAYVQILRPKQWLKNLMLYFPLFLGGGLKLPGAWLEGLLPFVSFCLVSSSAYVINDLIDAHRDAVHPEKCRRPIPSGKIGRRPAIIYALLLVGGGFVVGAMANLVLVGFLVAYLPVTLSYSQWLKHQPLVDVFCIAIGFLIRLEAGGAVFGIKVSYWLFLSVFLLALVLSIGKRLSEKQRFNECEKISRPVLLEYPPGFLQGAMYVCGSAVLVTYAMYVVTRPRLIYTIPLCTYGLLRYMMLVVSGRFEDPTEALLKDVQLLIVGLLWTVMIGYTIYFLPK